MVKDQHPQSVKDASASILPAWLDAFKVLLNLDPLQDVTGTYWDGLELRTEIFVVSQVVKCSVWGVDCCVNRCSMLYTHLSRD